jgi:hypothetical protein
MSFSRLFPRLSSRAVLRLAAVPALTLLMACAPAVEPEVVSQAPALPAMGWDHRAESDDWTEATLDALQRQGAVLLRNVPGDIGEWCPGYAEASSDERAAFWAGLLSALAKHESTWNPSAVGGGGKWFGLVQIAPATARGYGCEAGSGEALKDGEANLSCAVRIAARTVMRDGVVAAGGRGLAADWGPFHNRSKRSEMAAFTRNQSYCSAPGEA